MDTSFMPLLFPQPLVPVTSDADAAEASFYLVISPQVPAGPAQGKFCIAGPWHQTPVFPMSPHLMNIFQSSVPE
jgi:hypothetical protein